MADRMEFPKTMKEFIENYSFKDSEEVYTNGSMLIPTFRIEQALEHFEKKIRENVIDEFASEVKWKLYMQRVSVSDIDGIAEQMKGSEENG